MIRKALFETQPCGRCGGSGTFGPLSVQAGRCFGCGGNGTRLTKRGQAAQDFYRASLPTKLAKDLVVGDVFRSSATDRWATVTEVQPSPSTGTSTVNGVTTVTHYVDVKHTTLVGPFGKFSGQGLATTHAVTIYPGREEVIRLRLAALIYQGTLTEKGKPRKVKRNG